MRLIMEGSSVDTEKLDWAQLVLATELLRYSATE